MNKKKMIKIAAGIVISAIPFGLLTIGGYYAYKKFKEKRDKDKN